MTLNKEPTMHQIDDYNNKESPKKRKLIYSVIAIIIVIGLVYTGLRYAFTDPSADPYVGTSEHPGIYKNKGI